MASLNLIAPVLCAFDRPAYGKHLPQHLADCLFLPECMLKKLKSGGKCKNQLKKLSVKVVFFHLTRQKKYFETPSTNTTSSQQNNL